MTLHSDDFLFERLNKISKYWYNKAEPLKISASLIWKNMNGLDWGHPVFPVYLMLCGMALEVLYKAILVAKNIEPYHSHNLDVLASKAGLKYKEKQIDILKVLSQFIIWDGRYPTPTKIESLDTQHSLISKSLGKCLWNYKELSDVNPNQSDEDDFVRNLNVGILDPEPLYWDSYLFFWNDACEVYWTSYENENPGNKLDNISDLHRNKN